MAHGRASGAIAPLRNHRKPDMYLMHLIATFFMVTTVGLMALTVGDR